MKEGVSRFSEVRNAVRVKALHLTTNVYGECCVIVKNMNLKVGIVGLPNAGKSTLFNALLKRQVSPEGKYPFTTIQPFTGVVAVPDEKLKQLAQLLSPERIVPATVTFVDIAGLVKDSHKGEGLGNEFLGYIRDVNLTIHVIRGFEDTNIVHVMGSIDPNRDREIVLTELKRAAIDKPMVEWLNRDIADFDRLDDLIGRCYQRLGLITFYTIKGGKELHAWALKQGSSALDAAEKVHTDFAKKFIKAEVINVDILIESGGWKQAKEQGLVRLEGRNYVVGDGDVIEFKVGA